MAVLKISIPEKGCKKCPFLKKTIIDHNYYGETTTAYHCRAFDVKLRNKPSKCTKCRKAMKAAEREEAEFYKHLGEEINSMFLRFIEIQKEEKSCSQ